MSFLCIATSIVCWAHGLVWAQNPSSPGPQIRQADSALWYSAAPGTFTAALVDLGWGSRLRASPLYPLSVRVPLGAALDLPSILFMAGRPQANPKQAASAEPAPVLVPLPRPGPARSRHRTPGGQLPTSQTGSGAQWAALPLRVVIAAPQIHVSEVRTPRQLNEPDQCSRRLQPGPCVPVGEAQHPPSADPARVETRRTSPAVGVVLRSGRYMSPQSPCLDGLQD